MANQSRTAVHPHHFKSLPHPAHRLGQVAWPTPRCNPARFPMKTANSVLTGAVADLLQRDVAELERTKQPGGEVIIPKLKAAIRELRPSAKKFSVSKVVDSVSIKIGRVHPELLETIGLDRLRE